MEEVAQTKNGATKERWNRAMAEAPFDLIRSRVVIEIRAEHFLDVLSMGTVSTNIFLRRLHNFALDLGWLPAPLVPRKRWPGIRFEEKRAITFEEHQKVLAGETNPEWRAYYSLHWHLGGSQTDIASLRAEAIDWQDRTVSYGRQKTGSNAQFTLVTQWRLFFARCQRRAAFSHAFEVGRVLARYDRNRRSERILRFRNQFFTPRYVVELGRSCSTCQIGSCFS